MCYQFSLCLFIYNYPYDTESYPYDYTLSLHVSLSIWPLLKPSKSLNFLTLPNGQDPDDLVRGGGATAFERLAGQMQPLVDRLWQSELAAQPVSTPEQRAGLQARLSAHARPIQEIGRAACRATVGQYCLLQVVAVPLRKNTRNLTQ